MLLVEVLYSCVSGLCSFFRHTGPGTLHALFAGPSLKLTIQRLLLALSVIFCFTCMLLSGMKWCAALGCTNPFFIGDSHLDCVDHWDCEKTGVWNNPDGGPMYVL